VHFFEIFALIFLFLYFTLTFHFLRFAFSNKKKQKNKKKQTKKQKNNKKQRTNEHLVVDAKFGWVRWVRWVRYGALENSEIDCSAETEQDFSRVSTVRARDHFLKTNKIIWVCLCLKFQEMVSRLASLRHGNYYWWQHSLLLFRVANCWHPAPRGGEETVAGHLHPAVASLATASSPTLPLLQKKIGPHF
jgi:hypothetical protein